MVIVTSKFKGAIRAHFEPNHQIETSVRGSEKERLLDALNKIIDTCEFFYIEQPEMLGLGHAISCGDQVIGDEPFAVLLPDDLCHNEKDSVLRQMKQIYEKNPDCCVVAIEEVPLKEVNKYGVIDGELVPGSANIYQVESMVEKPDPLEAPTNLAIIGRYILIPEIFEALKDIDSDHNGEIQITDALSILAKKGKVLACKFQGTRFDCGSPKGFLMAANQMSEL